MRRYVVSPITGVTVAAVVAAASAVMGGRPGQYRIGFKKEGGEISLLGDFRTQAILAGVGLNALPWVAERAATVPVVGAVASWLGSLPGIGNETVQDYAGLAAAAALISLFSSEGMDMLETGKFMGLPVPERLVGFFRGLGSGEAAAPAALPAPTTTEEVALAAAA